MPVSTMVYGIAVVMAVVSLGVSVFALIRYLGPRHYPWDPKGWQKMPDGKVRRVIRP